MLDVGTPFFFCFGVLRGVTVASVYVCRFIYIVGPLDTSLNSEIYTAMHSSAMAGDETCKYIRTNGVGITGELSLTSEFGP